MATVHELVAWPAYPTPLGEIRYGGILEGVGGTGFDSFRTLPLHALVLLWSGHGLYRDRTGVSLRLDRGDLILIEPATAHQYGPDAQADWHELYICFKGDGLVAHFENVKRATGGPVLRLGDPQAWRERFWRIIDAPPKRFEDAISRVSLFHAALSDLGVSGCSPSGIGDAWIGQAKTLLRRGDLLPEAVAQRCGLSYSSFRRRFRERVGLAPGTFRRRAQLEKAELLLGQTRLSIAEIAAQCGFYDGAHLSHRFQLCYGASPSAWRRSATDGPDAGEIEPAVRAGGIDDLRLPSQA